MVEKQSVILITHKYFTHTFTLSLFNTEIEIDPTVLEDLQQYDIDHDLDAAPTHAGVTSAIKSMAYDKAPGQSKPMTDMERIYP
jgi:hypothetical protein